MKKRISTNYAELLVVLRETIGIEQTGTFVISVDGFMGSGKTCIARLLARELSSVSIHIDDFYNDPTTRKSTEDIFDYMEFEKYASSLHGSIQKHRVVITEGVCIQDILSRAEVASSFLVYAKWFDASGWWKDVGKLTKFEAGKLFLGKSCAFDRVVLDYHQRRKPHAQCSFTYKVFATA